MLANCLNPQSIEEAEQSIQNLSALFEQSFPGPLRDIVSSDIQALKSFISQVKAAQPTQSDFEAAFHFGG